MIADNSEQYTIKRGGGGVLSVLWQGKCALSTMRLRRIKTWTKFKWLRWSFV